MALETLKDVKEIGGYEIRNVCEDMGLPITHYLAGGEPIVVDHELNAIAFRIQNGPIKENGVNGCQVDTIIETAKKILEGLNKNFPCNENANSIACLQQSLYWINLRKQDRINRDVEGFSKA